MTARLVVALGGSLALLAAVAVVATTRRVSPLERLGLLLTPLGVAALTVLTWLEIA